MNIFLLLALLEIEAGAPEKPEEEIRLLLLRQEASWRPLVFTPEQILAIIDSACKDPCDLDYEVSQWSLPLLTTEIKKQGIADRISEEAVSRFYKMR